MSVAIDLTKTVKEIITTMKTVIDDIQDNYQTKTDIADTYESQTDANTAHTALQNSIAAKQDKLTFDNTPTADSLNPVTSDGIKTYVDNINSKLNTAISKKADSADIVQADWNATDTTLQSYIKNKPESVKIKYNLNLSSLDSTKFYPVVFDSSDIIHQCEIYSQEAPNSFPYNCNIISFSLIRQGWSDVPYSFTIEHYSCHDNKEITIGCIGSGNRTPGHHVVWLRGSLYYAVFSNIKPTLHTSDYTDNNETYTVGTNYYGGSGNANVNIFFTPQKTISSGPWHDGKINGLVEMAKNDINGNAIVATYATKADISNAVTTNNLNSTNLTVTGQTSVPTANQGNSSNAIASTEFVAKSISALVNGAPEQLNTLNELATALGNDSNFSATITAELGKKLDESEASDTYVTKTSYSIDVAALKTLITDTVNTGITTALQKVFPVGSIYTSVTDSRNPNAILGFGTWEAIPAGYGLVAQGTATAEDGTTLTFTAGNKYGEFKHQLTVGELAKHHHSIYYDSSYEAYPYAGTGVWKQGLININGPYGINNNVGEYTGGNNYHNNISPCVAAYLWKRTA